VVEVLSVVARERRVVFAILTHVVQIRLLGKGTFGFVGRLVLLAHVGK